MKGELKPVSFSRRQAPEPRLSAPYVPGKHSDRFWTEAERQVLRDHYRDKGFAYCAGLLPNRSKSGIYGEAGKLGLNRRGHEQQKKHAAAYPALDEQIAAAWPDLPQATGAVAELAEKLGVPRWMVSQRASKLGLTMPHKKEPNWTAAEDELMRRVPLHDVDKCSDIFRAHGFHRTPTAIMVRSKRIGLSRRFREALSATAAARILGCDGKAITAAIFEGRLTAGRRPTKRTVQQGGDWHTIQPADLRRYIIDNLERIDFRRVDKFALVEILTRPPEEKSDEQSRSRSAAGALRLGFSPRAALRDRGFQRLLHRLFDDLAAESGSRESDLSRCLRQRGGNRRRLSVRRAALGAGR